MRQRIGGVLLIFAVGMGFHSSHGQAPAVVPYPGSAQVPPFGSVAFVQARSPGSRPPPGAPQHLRVVSQSGQPTTVAYDGATLTVTAPVGQLVRFVSDCTGATANPASCGKSPCGQACVPGSNALPEQDTVTFTTTAANAGEAALDLADPRPCIPRPGRRACDANRTALWNGEAGPWAARGVTDPDARFNETVVFRVRAGDPVAISNIARILGTPYLKITRVRFLQDEFVEVTNLGGGPQDLTGWTVRSPGRDAVYRLPAGVVLRAGQTCTLYTHNGPPLINPGGLCRAYTNRSWVETPGGPERNALDVWPDDTGEVVLFYDALDLPGDDTFYSADPANQPPPPNLQLRPTGP